MSVLAPWRIVIVAEGPSDRWRLEFLVNHLIRRHGDEVADLDLFRRFEQFHGQSYIQIKDIPSLVRELGLDRRYSPGGPNKGDGGTLRKLYQVLQKEKLIAPDLVVIWARDDDGVPSRREEALQARQLLARPSNLLLAIASECGEAWVIAGWRATMRDDSRMLEELRQQLGFDPCVQPERLSHKENVPKSAKGIYRRLFAGDKDRQENALIVAVGEETNAGCGLRAFCDDVEAWLAERPPDVAS